MGPRQRGWYHPGPPLIRGHRVAARPRAREEPVKVVIGLGNPGAQYARTRHNIGWMVLDRLADRAGLAGRQKSRDACVTVRGRYQDLDLSLVKPTTFMNLSGVAVRKVLARDHVPLEDMLVVVDDFDLPLGRLRLREEGSAGTHNGLRSIVAEMGTQKFPRLRVGIGGHRGSAVDHVLSAFAPDEQVDLERVLDAAADAVLAWARDGGARAANRWNAWRLPEPPDGSAGPGPTEAPAGSGDDQAAAPGSVGSTVPDAEGILRTRTGWRRLLPHDPGKDG
jgi:peptidyl-tRNA hydrolase, PTH1 family